MTSELKPCPFCGGEAHFHCEGHFGREPVMLINIYCYECGVRTPQFADEEDAIEAWNTRAECTCRNVYDLEERGCENGFECSECGEIVADYESYKVKGTWNFCPGCGAKVVERWP